MAVHDAVNGITGEYATYLSTGPVPENASPEAAAIAAAHHALRNLFGSQAASLDALYEASLAAHALSEDDPGIEYGRSAAAAIPASRANDHSAQADEVGARLGWQVARFVSTHALRRCPGAGPNVTKTSGGHRARDDRVQPREDKTLRLRLPRGAALQSSSLKRPVPGLSGRDFRIRDEGRPLELEFFDG